MASVLKKVKMIEKETWQVSKDQDRTVYRRGYGDSPTHCVAAQAK